MLLELIFILLLIFVMIGLVGILAAVFIFLGLNQEKNKDDQKV
jgi:flagellar basal body-associated protein FliL